MSKISNMTSKLISFSEIFVFPNWNYKCV